MSRSMSLRGRAGQRSVTRREERLTRPVRREMKPEVADTPNDAPGDFEQVETDRADGGRRQARADEHRVAEVRQQQERKAMELQPEGIRAEAMAAKPVGVDVEFEFLDPILSGPTVVIPRDEIDRAAAAIGDHEAHIEALRGDVDLDQDAPLTRPGSRPMSETGANRHRTVRPRVTAPAPSRRAPPRES